MKLSRPKHYSQAKSKCSRQRPRPRFQGRNKANEALRLQQLFFKNSDYVKMCLHQECNRWCVLPGYACYKQLRDVSVIMHDWSEVTEGQSKS